MNTADIRLITPVSQQDIDATRGILTEYAEQLGAELCFQDLDAELPGLPGDYAAPAGALLLALVDGTRWPAAVRCGNWIRATIPMQPK